MRFGYTIIYVQNVLESVAFYEKAFGLQRRFIHESGQYAEMETGTTTLAFAYEELTAQCHLFKLNRSYDQPAGAEIAFIVGNVQEAFKQAVAVGAFPAVQPNQKPWGQIVSYVRDCNGFLVELCSEVSH